MDAAMLGERIRYYRLLRGMDEKAFGKRIHRSNATVSRLENGTQNISVHLLFAVANALDVQLWVLVMDDPYEPTNMELSTALQHLIRAARPLPESIIKQFTALANAFQERHT
jgi:transcriptional regulator with XRE-family HTH domain